MSNLLDYAKMELDKVGMTSDASDNINVLARQNILDLITTFSSQGQSGGSAPYILSMFNRLASFKPLSPINGTDDEWQEVSENIFQNNRVSSVFKTNEPDSAYWIDGIIFYEWYTDPNTNEISKVYFTSKDSRVPISFPWTMPESPEYVEANTNR